AVQLTVIGAIPWLLARVGPRLPMGLWHWLGIVPLAIGGLALLWCNWAFVVRGRGTAAPYDPHVRWSCKDFIATYETLCM
ncbi:MAG: hypothetical protein ACREXY_23210, partial [Gammaproteobacteria bacterium]